MVVRTFLAFLPPVKRSQRDNGIALLVLLAGLAGCADTASTTKSGDPNHGGDRATESPAADDDRGPDLVDVGTQCDPSDPLTIYTGTRSIYYPRIAVSDRQLGIAFVERDSDVHASQVMFAAVERSGSALEVDARPVLDAATAVVNDFVAIAGAGEDFALVWGDVRRSIEETAPSTADLYYTRVDAGGQRTLPELRISSQHTDKAESPAIARPLTFGVEGGTTSDQLAVAWRDGRSIKDCGGEACGRYGIYFKLIGLDGRPVIDDVPVSRTEATRDAHYPSLAFDGVGYAVGWANFVTPSRQQAFVARLRADGEKLWDQSMAENRGAYSTPPHFVPRREGELALVFSQNESLDDGVIYLTRMTTSDKQVAQHQISSRDSPCSPSIAFNGKYYGIAWQSRCGKDGAQMLFTLVDDEGRRVAPDGNVCVDDPNSNCGVVKIGNEAAGSVAAEPDIAAVDGDFALTWFDGPADSIRFSRVDCRKAE